MKKICALILAMFLVLGTVPSAAFAAEGDSPKICAIIDKTSVQPGETVSVTYMLPNAVNNVNEITVALHYDTSLFKYEGVNYSDSTFLSHQPYPIMYLWIHLAYAKKIPATTE